MPSLRTFLGGAIAQRFGWRATFLVCGGLGLLLALASLAMTEPARAAAGGQRPNLRAAAALLLRKRSFAHLLAGLALATLSVFSIVQFLTSFLIRAHHLAPVTAAQISGIVVGLIGFAVSLATGFVIDRGRARFPRIPMTLPAVAMGIAAIAYTIVFLTPHFSVLLPALGIAGLCASTYPTACFATAQDLAPPTLRATASSLLVLVVGVIGYAFGPPTVGLVSDLVAAHALRGTGLTPVACAAVPAVTACGPATMAGLRWGLVFIATIQLWAAAHFWLAGRTLPADRERGHDIS